MEFAEKKIKKPCVSCPFRRDNDLGTTKPGGSDPEVYLGQARGPFWLPCHKDSEYQDKNSSPGKVQQCAGAAMFRAHTNRAELMPTQILHLEGNHEIVFASEAEFYAHYTGLPIESCEEILNKETLDQLMYIEMNKSEAKKL